MKLNTKRKKRIPRQTRLVKKEIVAPTDTYESLKAKGLRLGHWGWELDIDYVQTSGVPRDWFGGGT